ncbi:MAG: hypothetical protein K0S33_1853 [Bacteroidetes bacterium]|nr:hypothetical protein [Bacteroidota bacterium]
MTCQLRPNSYRDAQISTDHKPVKLLLSMVLVSPTEARLKFECRLREYHPFALHPVSSSCGRIPKMPPVLHRSLVQ